MYYKNFWYSDMVELSFAEPCLCESRLYKRDFVYRQLPSNRTSIIRTALEHAFSFTYTNAYSEVKHVRVFCLSWDIYLI